MPAPNPRDFDDLEEYATADLVFRISVEEQDICPRCEDVVTPCKECIGRHVDRIMEMTDV